MNSAVLRELMVCTAVRHAAVKTVPSVIQSMASVNVNLATMVTTANTCVHEGSMDLGVLRSVSVAPPTVIM